jgi:excisionase family DNA binding protein
MSRSDVDVTEPRGFTVNEAAARLSVSRATLYRMRDDNQISFKKIRGRTIVPASEVRRIVAIGDDDSRSTDEAPVRVPVREPRKIRAKKIKLYPAIR